MFPPYRTFFVQPAALVFLLLCAASHSAAETSLQDQSGGDFQKYVRIADVAREAGNVEVALQNYSAALKLDPQWQEGWWNVGSLEYDRDHYAAAIPAFRTLVQLAPRASPAWTFLGLCEFETKDYANALTDLTKGEALGGLDDPEVARVAKYHLALLLIRNSNFPKATTLLVALADAQHASPQLTFALGLARLGLPLLPDEVAASQVAQVQQAGEAAASEQLAVAAAAPHGEMWDAAMQAYSAGQYVDAIAKLKEWLQQNPQSGTGWAVLGLSEFAVHDYDAALAHLQRGQQLGLQGSAESVQLAEYNLGILLNQTGQFAAAQQTLVSALTSAPTSVTRAPQITFALGVAVLRLPVLPEQVADAQRPVAIAAGKIAALLHDSKYDQAFPKLEALIAKYPDTPFLHYTYGTALASLSQYDEAAKQFHAELPLSPRSELPYLGLASLELQRHRAADALPSAQRAAELAPRSATAHYLLGRSLLETGKPDAAIAEFLAANTITPGSPEVHFALAKAYAKSGQAEKAAQERALFAQLNAQSEQQRSHQGNQAYGAHEAPAAALSGVTPPSPAPPNPR
jgi:predicted Zn-dependent protease